MAVAILLCVRCGSHSVDVVRWPSRTVATLRCSACGGQSSVTGFTVGRVWREDEGALVTSAIEDAALPLAVKVG